MALSMSTKGTDYDICPYCVSKLGPVLQDKVHKWCTSFEQIKYQLVSKIFNLEKLIGIEMDKFFKM